MNGCYSCQDSLPVPVTPIINSINKSFYGQINHFSVESQAMAKQ